tara:strand:- start:8098 stop:8628 length:531 start_codon:yes stop_codon:yes gene_type:complete
LNNFQHLKYIEFNSENRYCDSHYASVAICILPTEEIIFIKRQETMPTHKGQIAFPGGKAQKEDLDIVDTAVREASEELLISKDALSPFGILNGYDTREFQYPVFPVLCKLDSVDLSIFDTSEVQKILAVNLSYLQDKKNWSYRGYYDSDWIITIEGEVLWGATAKMTAELLQLKFD